MKIILILSGLILTLNGVLMGIYANFNIGILLTAFFGIFLLLWGAFYEKLREMCKTGIMKYLKYTVVGGISAFLLLCVFLFAYGNASTADYTEDAVIVLGAGIRGETVTYPLKTRLDGAIEYYEKNPSSVIVVSGGKGAQEDITEAEAMEKHLISKGIPKEKIIKEDKAKSTTQNLIFSKNILDERFGENNYKSVVITNDFHCFRAKRIAKKIGLTASHKGTALQLYNYPPNYIREALALLKTFIIGI